MFSQWFQHVFLFLCYFASWEVLSFGSVSQKMNCIQIWIGQGEQGLKFNLEAFFHLALWRLLKFPNSSDLSDSFAGWVHLYTNLLLSFQSYVKDIPFLFTFFHLYFYYVFYYVCFVMLARLNSKFYWVSDSETYLLGPAASAGHLEVHGAQRDSPQSTEGFSRHYSWDLLNNLPKVHSSITRAREDSRKYRPDFNVSKWKSYGEDCPRGYGKAVKEQSNQAQCAGVPWPVNHKTS